MTTSATLRREMQRLNARAAGDLDGLWHMDETALREALHDVLPDLIDTYGLGASALTADWYDEVRDQAGVSRAFQAIPGDIPDVGAGALVGWATAESNSPTAFRALVLGGMQRRISNFSRLTITGSSIADPAAVGWKRVGLGRCAFCRMLIGRGAVYREATANFDTHDSCQCSAVPDFA